MKNINSSDINIYNAHMCQIMLNLKCFSIHSQNENLNLKKIFFDSVKSLSISKIKSGIFSP